MRLDGETRIFVIVGDPIAQVRSPAGLSAILAERGVNALVLPAHVAAADFPTWFRGVRHQRNLDGIILTIPHKVAAFAYCDELTSAARWARSANVMRRLADDRWWGDNTDGRGFVDGLSARGFSVAGKRALIAGVGGAGGAIAYEILARGAAFLAVHDIDSDRRAAVAAGLETRFPGKVGLGGRDPRGFDLLANATPLGMAPSDQTPFETDLIERTQFLADVVTKPELTPLIATARAIGASHMTGSGMFEAQASRLVDLLLDPQPGGSAGPHLGPH